MNSSRWESSGTPSAEELGAVGVEAPGEGLVGHLGVALDVLLDVAGGQRASFGHQVGDERELADELVGVVGHGVAIVAYRPQAGG